MLMRGVVPSQSQLFQYVTISLESYLPEDHPLRGIRALTDRALHGMQRQLSELYAKTGRPSIPPEQLLRALLLQSLYSIRSERQLVEQLRYNLLFRWFVGLEMEDKIWDFSTFSQNRTRFLSKDIAGRFQSELLQIADAHRLLSREHFTVDGTLLDAAASLKSFLPNEQPAALASVATDVKTKDGNKHTNKKDDSKKDDPGNPDVDFHGQRRTNATHTSTTDPEAKLYRKGSGKEAKLSYLGHVLMENRHGLIVGSCVTHATGTAERDAAEILLTRHRKTRRCSASRITLGADKGYDAKEFIGRLRAGNITPHIAAKRFSILDGRTLRRVGYQISQRKRKRVEEIFGWLKSIAGLGTTRFRGRERIEMAFGLGGCAYNILRIANILNSA